MVAGLNATVSQDGSNDESTGGETAIPRDEVQELDGRVLSFPYRSASASVPVQRRERVGTYRWYGTRC